MIGKTVYIGDTAQDIKSANQAHVQTCAVTWGAQSAHELLYENPHYVVNNPEEFLTILYILNGRIIIHEEFYPTLFKTMKQV